MVSSILGSINEFLGNILFFDILFGQVDGISIPFLVAWLAVAAVYFTVVMGFPNLRFFKHAFEVMLGKWQTMTLKFTEVTLSLQYRTFLPDGTVLGGGMRYLSEGLKEKGMPRFGRVLALIFAIFMLGGALGGGNAFQVSQSLGAVKNQIPILAEQPWIFGVTLAVITGLVIIGGVKSIANVTERIVPLMVFIYDCRCRRYGGGNDPGLQACLFLL